MFVTFSHYQVQILIGLPRNKTVMVYSLLELRDYSPSIPMQRLQKTQTSSVQTRIDICSVDIREWIDVDTKDPFPWKMSESNMVYCRMIVRQRTTVCGRDWCEHQGINA